MWQRPFLRVLTTNRRLLLGTGRFWREKNGSVLPILALLAACMVGVAALAVDLSRVYIVSLQSQRVADMADMAAFKTGITDAVTPKATATAQNVATINGIASANSNVTVAYVTSPRTGGGALETTVKQSVPILFGSKSAGDISGGGSALVEVTPFKGNCLTSFLTTQIQDRAIVTAPNCSASMGLSLDVNAPAQVTLSSVAVGVDQLTEKILIGHSVKMVPYPPQNFTYNQTDPADPVASTPAVIGLKAHLDAMTPSSWPSPSYPVNPAVPNSSTDVTASGTVPNGHYDNLTLTGATVTFLGSGAADPNCKNPTTFSGATNFDGNNTLTFNSGCYVFDADVWATSGTTNFNAVPGADVVYVFHSVTATSLYAKGNSSIIFNNTDGVSTNLANITYYFNGGTITILSGSTMTFASGPFYLWGGSLANSGTFKAGNGPFTFYGGTVYNNDNSAMTWGNGPFSFYGGSLAMAAGSTTVFGTGNMDFYGGSIGAGGNSVTFGNNGSASAGSGTVALYGGSFALTSGSLTAVGETFGFLGGTLYLNTQSGMGTVNATAPTSVVASPSTGYQNVLFAIWGGAFQYQQLAGTDTLSGVIYVPNSGVQIQQNSVAAPPSNGCLGIVANTIQIQGNTNMSFAPCSSAGVVPPGTLIQ